jgi:hypothetical protein
MCYFLYFRRIARPTSQMVAETASIVDGRRSNNTNRKNNKTQLLASNYGMFRSLIVCENFHPKTDPLLSSSMRQASLKCETTQLELESSATFLATKCCQRTKFWKVIKLARSSLKTWVNICAHRGRAVLKICWVPSYHPMLTHLTWISEMYQHSIWFQIKGGRRVLHHSL